MKIAILGTRGIPNQYGGFEQFADILSQGLVQMGHNITVYCSKNHKYKEGTYNGVRLIHKFDPENKIGTAGQFLYDLTCILDAQKKDFDIIYLLGYTSSSIWQRLLKDKSIVVTNMDGLEWKRSKYSTPVQRFLQYAENLAVKYSDYLVADSIGIQKYLSEKYGEDSTYLPYGSYVFENPNENILDTFKLSVYQYDILVARFEPENNIEMILSAFHNSTITRKLVLIGNYKHTEFGNRMYSQFSVDERIVFLGAIYDQNDLDNLRYFSNLYFHGHSVGGTNPSLLEAMGSNALVCFHDNDFNRAIIENDGFGFTDSKHLQSIIEKINKLDFNEFLLNNKSKVRNIYEWETIISKYEAFFQDILKIRKSR